jgi:hypothetical protein
MGYDRPRRGHDRSRDPGAFVALPCAVLDSYAYLNLSHPAKSLLLEIARQYVGDNNGRLLASRAYLKKRGWNSADTISRALKELIEAKLVYQTVQGHRPNKASWFAVTWRVLDRLSGYDHGAFASFERSAYTKVVSKNTGLRPSRGIVARQIGPPNGQFVVSPSPSPGLVSAHLSPIASLPVGHHLESHLNNCAGY